MADLSDLSISGLRALYRQGSTSPTQVMTELHSRTNQDNNACYIAMTPLEDLQERCRILEAMPASEQAECPLWGIPFAVKDNIDVEGFPTTAACREFGRQPAATSAPTVQTLTDAGAVMLGKTNMDQFAAGLVGTRSPYGTPKNAFDERFIPGGSSSGSGALIGRGLATFTLGTDTAGSDRKPDAPFHLPCLSKGVVPACRSLDCVTCFARNVEDAAAVIRIMQTSGVESDASVRRPPQMSASPKGQPACSALRPVDHVGISASAEDLGKVNGSRQRTDFKFGVPSSKHLEFDGPGGPDLARLYKESFQDSMERLKELGGEEVQVDFGPLCRVAEMLYNSAFLAERYAGIQEFLEACKGNETTAASIREDPRLERVTAEILSKGRTFAAYEAFQAFARLAELRCVCEAEMQKVDVLLVPTVLQHFLVAEVEAEEKQAEPPTWPKNALNGRFTNFVNLLDMAAISVPTAIVKHPLMPCSGDGHSGSLRRRMLANSDCPTPELPLGVTLIGPAWSDEWLWSLGKDLHGQSGLC